MKKMNERKKNPGRFLMVFLMMALMMLGVTAVSAASEDRVIVQFRDSGGNPVSSIPDMVIEEGKTIVLPDRPGKLPFKYQKRHSILSREWKCPVRQPEIGLQSRAAEMF